MSILVRRYLGRSRYVEELVEDWQIAYQKAQFSLDVQDLITECIELGKFAKITWDHLTRGLFDENVTMDHDTIGQSMEIALEKTLQVFTKVQRMVKHLRALDCPTVDNETVFGQVVQQTREIHREYKEQWPSFDQTMADEALAAYGRGEYDHTEALVNGKEGCGSEAD